MSVIFSKTAKSVYIGILLFISQILYRQLGTGHNWKWYILIAVVFGILILLVININNMKEED